MLNPCQHGTVQAGIFSCRPLARAGLCVHEYVCVYEEAGGKQSLTRSRLCFIVIKGEKNATPTVLGNSGASMLYFYFRRNLKFGFGTDLGLLTPSNSLVLAKSDASADVLRKEGLP